MFRISVEEFSGRPNPTWFVTEDAEVQRLLAAVEENPGAIARPGTGFNGLGFREVIVTRLGDEPDLAKSVPAEFGLASTACEDLAGSGELARRLIEQMTEHMEIRLVEHEITPLTAAIAEYSLQLLDRHLSDPPASTTLEQPKFNPLISTITDDRCERCRYEVSHFNPAFWNRPAVQPRNNCYNYARNWRTDTFAQPGRAHGASTSVMSCPTVSAAAKADGLRPRCECLPDSEYPRRLIALVVAPGIDYHWFRHQRGGFWGHKPGPTAARNVDNSNNLIINPEIANRGPYTQFCGYFYAGRSVVID